MQNLIAIIASLIIVPVYCSTALAKTVTPDQVNLDKIVFTKFIKTFLSKDNIPKLTPHFVSLFVTNGYNKTEVENAFKNIRFEVIETSGNQLSFSVSNLGHTLHSEIAIINYPPDKIKVTLNKKSKEFKINKKLPFEIYNYFKDSHKKFSLWPGQLFIETAYAAKNLNQLIYPIAGSISTFAASPGIVKLLKRRDFGGRDCCKLVDESTKNFNKIQKDLDRCIGDLSQLFSKISSPQENIYQVAQDLESVSNANQFFQFLDGDYELYTIANQWALDLLVNEDVDLANTCKSTETRVASAESEVIIRNDKECANKFNNHLDEQRKYHQAIKLYKACFKLARDSLLKSPKDVDLYIQLNQSRSLKLIDEFNEFKNSKKAATTK